MPASSESCFLGNLNCSILLRGIIICHITLATVIFINLLKRLFEIRSLNKKSELSVRIAFLKLSGSFYELNEAVFIDDAVCRIRSEE